MREVGVFRRETETGIPVLLDQVVREGFLEEVTLKEALGLMSVEYRKHIPGGEPSRCKALGRARKSLAGLSTHKWGQFPSEMAMVQFIASSPQKGILGKPLTPNGFFPCCSWGWIQSQEAKGFYTSPPYVGS